MIGFSIIQTMLRKWIRSASRLEFKRKYITWALFFSLMTGYLLFCGCKSLGTRFNPHSRQVASITNFVGSSFTNGIRESWLVPPTNFFTLGPGDRIDIEVLGDGNGPISTFVGPDGKIYFHLLPGLNVWGLTLAQAKQLLEKELAQYVRDPHIAITLRGIESKRVWVLGRLNDPGIYVLAAPMTVVEAITKAGGLFTSRFSGTTEELADLHHSFLIRKGEFLPIHFHKLLREGDMTQNIYLEPDDFIYLPSSLSQEIYVLGAVYQPRAVGFKDQVTLVSAIANARGPIANAYLSHVVIVRGSLSQPSIAIVNLKAIMVGKAPDIRLQPRDIVYVPFDPFQSLEKYTFLIMNTFARTVAANEGGRAAVKGASPVGVNIGIGN